MLFGYFKIAFRNLINNKVYALISILGLAIGISGSTLIALYIQDEMSYDAYHEKADRIYRLTTILDFNGTMDVGLTNYLAGPTLMTDYPEVENFVRFYGGNGEAQITAGEHVFRETNFWITDSSIFHVFSYHLISGNPASALTAPNSVVLTQSMADKYFPETDAFGKEMKMNNTVLNVTGVMENPPANSEIPINALVSMTTLPPQFHATFGQDWFRVSFFTFLLMRNPVDPIVFDKKLVEFEKKYVQPWSEANNIVAGHEYSITAMKEVHFDNTHEYDMPKGNKNHIYIFGALALFLLFVAAINFINLMLAQQTKRAKEVGVRKTLGASSKSLILRFLAESFVVTIIAMIIGLSLSEILINPFNVISGKMLNSHALFTPMVVGTDLLILLVIGLLAGSYPAVVLSSLKPVNVLKGQVIRDDHRGLLRKALILLQFTFSMFMIAGTFLIRDQITYMHSVDLGFDRENLVSVDLPIDTANRRRIQPWIDELKNDSRIVSTSRTSLPTNGGGELMFRIEQNGKMEERAVKFLFVDDEFAEVLGLTFSKGRNFSKDHATDVTSSFIVNEKAAESFGWGNDALNKRIQWNLQPNGTAANDGVVVGVLNDFHFQSLHNALEPLVLCYNPNGGQNLSLRLTKGDYTNTLSDIETSWNEVVAGVPFSFSFYDQDLEANYTRENNMYRIFMYFASVAIVLACLGLFALLSYTIESRRKEIGIRKVLGAGNTNLSWIIAKDFVYIMLLAFCIAMPVDYYLVKNWQTEFAYTTGFNVWSYVLALLLAGLLSMIAVGYHSLKIAVSNPVDSLREE
ncbi:MAG: FtsX-like permease family protein [Bacteroidetes bacterium]|nr:FtsX-like permease family protein [Bacteroidota bacterium]